MCPASKIYLLLFVFKQQCLKDLKQDYLEKQDRYKSLASVNEMHTKVEELQKQMAWALVSPLPSISLQNSLFHLFLYV